MPCTLHLSLTPRRRAFLLLLSSCSVPLLVGCHKGSTVPGAGSAPVEVAALVPKTATPPDLAQPFNVLAWSMSGAGQDPLSVGAQMAVSAGGDWIVVAPKPFDAVKWTPKMEGGMGMGMGGRRLTVVATTSGSHVTTEEAPDAGDGSVRGSLEAIKASGTPVAWEVKDGHGVLFFGTDEELGTARAHPPTNVTGLYLHAHSSAALVAMVADFWKLPITADPQMLRRRDALIRLRKREVVSEEPRGMIGAMSSMYRRGMGGTGTAGKAAPEDVLTLKIEERMAPAELLNRLAAKLGGECRKSGERYEMVPIAASKKLEEEITRLKGVIEESSGVEIVHSTPNPMSGEPVIVIGGLPEEAMTAMENLAAIGAPAVPALTEYLKPERAAQAQVAVRALDALDLPEARRAILDFGTRLQSGPPLTGKAEKAAPLLQAEIIRVAAAKPDPNYLTWLGQAARDGRLTSDLRERARMALVRHGAIAYLMPASTQGSPASADWLQFELAPTVAPKPGASDSALVRPIAEFAEPGGQRWAVFFSGRCGGPTDMWIARGTESSWQEFVFTGASFPNQNESNPYAGTQQPGAGCLKLTVEGDSIHFLPPTVNTNDDEILRLQNKLMDRTLPQKQRMQISVKFSQLQQRQWQMRSKLLQQSMDFKLSKLREDRDGDGLTDLVEARIGTDPGKKDTDGDGVPDRQDPSPLTPKSATQTVRQRLLQAVFTAVFSGDPNPEPIVVVLEREDWQEFAGSRAPVLCMTKDSYLKKAAKGGGFRVLQFGGPTDRRSTILDLDGPCAFNESHTRAEVHFWHWSPRNTRSNPWMMFYQMDSSAVPTDYIATLSRRGSAWKLDAISPWATETVDSAFGEYMKKVMENNGMW